MKLNYMKESLKTALYAAGALLLGVGSAVAQQQVNLTAGPASVSLPDGSSVPMWGYSCGAAVSGSTATCAALSPKTGWSPVVITVPTGQDLTINLTNNLSFGTTQIPTSLVIVGQLGGGLGNSATSTQSPDHSGAQSNVTWPIANNGGGTGTPPVQGNRVQSFSTEVAVGATTPLTWKAPRAGTYLIESGTHPSIQGSMGLYGILVVTAAPSGGTAGTAYTGVSYNAEVPLLFSEIDPVQNRTVSAAVNTAGFSETTVWSGQPGGCGYPTSPTYLTCYPPVVNYTPLYYMINGVAFDKTNTTGSLFPVSPATGVTGNVLVRLVNAGSRMHVPAIVGSQTGAPATGGFSLIAEDGNRLPGLPRVQNEVFMAAGKTYDVMVNVPTSGAALPVYDRELSLSGNATARDSGMLAYIGINGAAPAAGSVTAMANPDTYPSVLPSEPLTVSDPSKGVVANDVNINGVAVPTGSGPAHGSLNLNADGTFTYIPDATWAAATSPTTADSFVYCGNGVTLISPLPAACTTVTLGLAPIEAGSGIIMNGQTYTSKIATFLKIASPGVLSADKDTAGYPLTVVTTGTAKPTVTSGTGTLNLTVDPKGGFNAIASAPGTYTFTYSAQNSQGTVSSTTATVTLTFPTPSNLAVKVLDGADKTTVITDYRWIIEEDLTFFVDPACMSNPLPSNCPTATPQGAPAAFGMNFHTSHMPVVAAGCTGTLSCEGGQTVLGQNVVCDQGNGACRPDTTGNGKTAVDPSQVNLDPTKRYYLSVLPGDAAQPFIAAYLGTPDCSPTGVAAGHCGHGMGGAPVPSPCPPSAASKCSSTASFAPVTVITEPSPYPPAKLSVFVFEDDYPLNGEHDAGGGIDVLSPDEPGLGGFQITLYDNAGGTGDATGTPTYDMFNQPLTNSLAGSIDPVTGLDACPIGNSRTGMILNPAWTSTNGVLPKMIPDPNQGGITGMIVTCPKYESDGKTLSPMAGQAQVPNLYPGRYGVAAYPNADRIARGEEWLQTNTLDGQKAHDSFMRIGEPGYFQEFGPAGYHVTIGFANPKIINDRKPAICAASTCTNEVKGHVTTARMSRTPDERLYGSGNHDSYAFTQCYASIGDPDGADFSFVKCDADGNFDFTGLPAGNFKLTLFDQWNDQVVDGISTPVGLAGQSNATLDLGEVAVHQWQADFFSRTFLDLNGDGVSSKDTSGMPCTGTNIPAGCNANYGSDVEPGLALVKTNVRFRDGSFSNRNNTDLNGYAAFNEEFPLFNWYVIETDNTRYKNTGTHVVYDAGGPTDNTPGGGTSTIAANYANTIEAVPLPANLRVPGAVYCNTADCTGLSIATGPVVNGSSGPGGSTGRIDPPWVETEGWQGYSGQNNFLEFGKKPYAAATPGTPATSTAAAIPPTPAENGGINGHVIYSSTRPFDDPQFNTQNVWEPLVPDVTINLYQEKTAPDGTASLTLVDTTQTSSFDKWVQGFRSDGVPNMNCPGQTTTDPFFFGLENQPNYLDWYNSLHGGPAVTALPDNSQFKCYDGMHNWNQLQPAPYDGMYQFPSVTGLNPTTGKPTGTNCTICVGNPDASDPYRFGLPMLPAGKYVAEVVPPPGYEVVKEEDKNILIGDNFIAPATVQIPGLGSAIYILPDQAEISSVCNATSSSQNPTCSLGRNQALTSHEGDTPTVDTFWPCVGETRIVPDYISLFPNSKEVAPFAGATRNLCDRKEVTLDDQTSSQAEFFLFTPTHIASKFTGVTTDDFDAEFDPFSPQFGEKFGPAYLPVSIKDWAGNEISRTYSDQWGAYNGLSYSTYEVNPPNPTGYAPTMMVTCMNDPGTGTTPDPLFQPGYANFCYELPFMPGTTGYFDTPVVPTSSFAGGYNHPDCAYPDATPAIASVTSSDIAGPWVSAAGISHILTITALGNQSVENNAYSGPGATTSPFNQQKVTRHYGFGASQGTGSVTIGGINAPVTGWSDTQITVSVPAGVPACAMQQQAQYENLNGVPAQPIAKCGQLVVTTGSGKQSIDTVTVTVGGKTPTVLAAGQTIQSAIDAANPGDMIIVPPGSYTEMLLMWKPLRLQGVGAASSVIDANPHPAGRLDPWRRQVICLFGLALDGAPINTTTGNNPYDSTGNFTCNSAMQFSVDRLPLEATVGWDATLNGNLAEQLIEPTLMGAYEGSGITVLAKGVKFNTTDPAVIWASDVYPAGTQLLKAKDCGASNGTNPYPSNFWCNPARIDGLSVTNSSQGGGGILVHGWAHNLEIANNRVHSNQGTLSGGITIGQGEHPDVSLAGTAPLTIPGSCESDPLGTLERGQTPNQALPYCYDMYVNIHNNAVTLNSSLGDELFSSTPAGAGGVTMCNGSDYYKFNYNWVCGNMSTGDGGGVAHLGFIKNGDIEHNSILFNQSANPSITTNGGGLLVMGAPDADPPCGLTTDQDCLSAPNTISPSDGTGPGLVINANLIMGNGADSGSGGGLRLQHINGTDVLNFPNGAVSCQTPGSATCLWNSVTVTNNIITNNVAGWDGGGVSLQDALAVNIVNNTIVSNDSTASAGPLFGSLFAPLASTPVTGTSGVNCSTTTPPLEQSCPQAAGLVSVTNSPVLIANLPTGGITCPPGHGTSGSCASYSVPLLTNNVIWQNRSFVVGVGGIGAGGGFTSQQKLVSLYNAAFNNTSASVFASSQTATGACPTPSSYWDIGVRGDTGPSNHNGGQLTPTYSVLTDAADYPGANNLGANPTLVSQYCNGSRVPPELGSMGYSVTPGTNEVNALPTPVFSLTTSATVDEGNNWVNLRWGPTALASSVTGATLGNYALAQGSPAIDYVPHCTNGSTAANCGGTANVNAAYTAAPTTDFFGNPRPDPAVKNLLDIGAIEFQGSNVPPPTVSSITPSSGVRGTTIPVTITGTNFTATGTTVTLPGSGDVTIGSMTVVSPTSITLNLTFTATATRSARTVTVTTPGGSASTTFTVTGPTLTSVAPPTGARGTSVPVTISGAGLTGATAITVTGTGVTVSAFTAVNATTVTATFTITPTATLSPRNVTVSTPAGVTNAVTFTVVNPPAPTVSSITPSSGVRGTTIPVTITGNNFTATGTIVTLPGSGDVTIGSMTVVSSTSITLNLTFTATATRSARTVTVTTPGGSASTTFTVTGPTLTSVAPPTGARGTSVPVTISGAGLTGATAITVTGTGVTVSAFTAVNATTVTATFTITPTATLSPRNVTVSTPAGATNAVTFTVVNPLAPTVSSITPNSGVRGTTIPVTITGNNFTATGTTVTLPGSFDVTIGSVTVVSPTSITVNLTFAVTATASARTVTVTTPGGSASATFTVLRPTLTSIAPPAGTHGTTVPVTLTGMGLNGATAITVSGTGVACTVTSTNSTTVTANCAITSGAALTARNVTATTPAGVTNTLTGAFTVN
jgi:hypothetical protein